MFADKELEGTIDYCERKIDDILNKEGGSDADYIRNLQTLVTLKDAANKKIQLFRKKPVEIEAVRWKGDNLAEVIRFTGLHESALKWTWDQYESVVAREGLKIFTLEGSMLASIGDWIIKGVRGEFYPIKNNIFLETYEPV